MSIWRYADLLHPVPAQVQFSLGEGGTPVVRSHRIGNAIGLPNLYFKLESCNPTGSYKDRFAAAAISQMRATGKRRCVATSSGNAGSALAGYCAAAGLTCEVAIVEEAPQGKLLQMLSYGAKLFRIRGFGIDSEITGRAVKAVVRRGSAPDASLQISAFKYSPAAMTGVQTISYELAEQIDRPIDHVFCPAGGGGLTQAVAQGFVELVQRGKLKVSPKIECVQPAGNDTIATPLRAGDELSRIVNCTTAVSGLQVPTIVDGHDVIRLCRASGGTGHIAADERVWEVQARMAREEGIFTEPAGAVALTGVLDAFEKGLIASDACVVCLVTGSAFKDPPSIQRMTVGTTNPLVELADFEKDCG